jgi:hypothetical protein
VLAALAHSDTHIPSRAVEMARSARQHPEGDSPDSPTEPVSPSSPIRASEEWAVAASAPPIPRSSLVSLAPSHMLSPLICCLPSYAVSPPMLPPSHSFTSRLMYSPVSSCRTKRGRVHTTVPIWRLLVLLPLRARYFRGISSWCSRMVHGPNRPAAHAGTPGACGRSCSGALAGQCTMYVGSAVKQGVVRYNRPKKRCCGRSVRCCFAALPFWGGGLSARGRRSRSPVPRYTS